MFCNLTGDEGALEKGKRDNDVVGSNEPEVSVSLRLTPNPSYLCVCP